MKTLQLNYISLIIITLLINFSSFAQTTTADCTGLVELTEIKLLTADANCNCDYNMEYIFNVNSAAQTLFNSNTVNARIKINPILSNLGFANTTNNFLEFTIDFNNPTTYAVKTGVNIIGSTIIYIPDEIELVGGIELSNTENSCSIEYNGNSTMLTYLNEAEALPTLAINLDFTAWAELNCDDLSFDNCKTQWLQLNGIIQGNAINLNDFDVIMQNGNVETDDEDIQINNDDLGQYIYEPEINTIINVDDIWEIKSVYPNPTIKNNNVYVEIYDTDLINGINYLKLLNSSLNIVRVFKVTELKTQIELSNIEPGIYFIQLRKNNALSNIKELIIY